MAALFEWQFTTNESELKTRETGPDEDRRKKKKSRWHRTVECDGIKRPCYNPSPDKNDPQKKKLVFKDDGFSLSGWLFPDLVHLTGGKPAAVTEAGCCRPSSNLHAAFSVKKKKKKCPEGHFTVSIVTSLSFLKLYVAVSSETPRGVNKR